MSLPGAQPNRPGIVLQQGTLFMCKMYCQNKKGPLSISYNSYPTQFQAWSTPDKYSNYRSQKGSMRLSLNCQSPEGGKERHHFQTTNKHYYQASFYMRTQYYFDFWESTVPYHQAFLGVLRETQFFPLKLEFFPY